MTTLAEKLDNYKPQAEEIGQICQLTNYHIIPQQQKTDSTKQETSEINIVADIKLTNPNRQGIYNNLPRYSACQLELPLKLKIKKHEEIYSILKMEYLQNDLLLIGPQTTIPKYLELVGINQNSIQEIYNHLKQELEKTIKKRVNSLEQTITSIKTSNTPRQLRLVKK